MSECAETHADGARTVDLIRTEIAQTRAELAARIDEISGRVHPASTVSRGRELIRSAGRSPTADAGPHPVPRSAPAGPAIRAVAPAGARGARGARGALGALRVLAARHRRG